MRIREKSAEIAGFFSFHRCEENMLFYWHSSHVDDSARNGVMHMTRWLARAVNAIRSRLLYKMLILYSLLTLTPLVVVGTTFYVRTSQLVEKNVTEDVNRELNETASKMDGHLYTIMKRLLALGEQSPILALAEIPDVAAAGGRERSATERAAVELLAAELAETRQQAGPFVDNLYLLRPGGALYSAEPGQQLQYAEAFTLMPFEFERMAEWAFFTDNKRMACVLKLYADGSSATSGNVIGYLVLTLDPAQVAALYDRFERDTFYVVNSDNLVLSAASLSSIGRLLDTGEARDSLVIRQKSQYADFQYVRLAKAGASAVVKKQAVFSIAVTLAAWAAVFAATYWILKRVTHPIQRLTRLMRKAEREEYQLMHGVMTKDEIAMLCHGYNRLVMRTEELIDNNYKNELMARESELKAIRMYINPHFLYNVMEYISIMSQTPDKAKFVPDVVQKLSSIFRFSIMPGDSFVSLVTEIAFAEKYLQIHKYRFGERLRYRIELPAMLHRVAVPRLILQPLVENCIVHGIERLSAGGSIDIVAREEHYQLVVEIRNDAPDIRSTSAGAAADGERGKGLGSGLDNVNARIRHHYGGAYGAALVRSNGQAVVRVLLPIDIRQEESA